MWIGNYEMSKLLLYIVFKRIKNNSVTNIFNLKIVRVHTLHFQCNDLVIILFNNK